MLREEKLGSLTLLQSTEEFRLGRDSLALARFAGLHRGDRVCDLGCGVGSLLLALAEREMALTLDGVEIRASAAELCRENLRCNGLSGTIVTGEMQNRYPELPWGGYDLVTANPPYFPTGTGKTAQDAARAQARTEGTYTIQTACAVAARLCRNGGKFALCLRPERLAEVFQALQENHFAPKRMQLLQSAPEREANLALIEAIRGGKPGLRMLPVKIER